MDGAINAPQNFCSWLKSGISNAMLTLLYGHHLFLVPLQATMRMMIITAPAAAVAVAAVAVAVAVMSHHHPLHHLMMVITHLMMVMMALVISPALHSV